MNKALLSFLLSLSVGISSLGSGVFRRLDNGSPKIEEQALFSGFYAQSSPKGDGNPVSLPAMPDGFVRFDVHTREASSISWSLNDEYIISNCLYSEEKSDYALRPLDTDRYFENGELKSNEQTGPKSGHLGSTCKIRAYYRDVQTFFGLATVMYDFTGFLVGESLLMTAAHGLYLDVTTGPFDDGVENYYFPGKIEVYGAIGLADDWGESYTYYSLCNEVFMDTDYITSRTINNDWAFLRLQNPLGRVLPQRTLIVSNAEYETLHITGYPSWNQGFQTQVATNFSILSSYGQLSYSTTTYEGMSGSAICYPEPGQSSGADDFYAWEYDSSGKPCLRSNCAYGMHLSYDHSNGIGYGVRFTYDMISLADALNSKYRPSAIDFSSLTGASLNTGDRVCFSPDYYCDITLSGCSVSNGSIRFDTNSAYATLAFNFPVSGINLASLSPNAQGCGLAEIRYINSDGLFQYVVANPTNLNLHFEDPSRLVMISAVCDEGASLNGITLEPDWNCYFPNNDHPPYSPFEIDADVSNNCVSYAVKALSSSPSGFGSIVAVDDKDCSTIKKGVLMNPEFVVSELKRELSKIDYGINITDIGKYDECAHGGYKIAILCDPFNYYHVARLNRDGYWSHFIVNQGVFDADSLGDQILNIENAVFCNGPLVTGGTVQLGSNYYETPFDLTSVVGYFEVYNP